MSDQFMSREERRKARQTKSTKPSSPKKARNSVKAVYSKDCAVLGYSVCPGIVGGAAAFAVLVSGAPSLDEAKLKTPYSSTIYDKTAKKSRKWAVKNEPTSRLRIYPML